MEVKDVVLTVVSHEGGSFTGNTLLQKKIFFLNEGLSMGISFKPHYYGPYSEEVASEINTLVGLNFLSKSAETFPSNNIWGEIRRYTYELTEEGEEILGEIKNESEHEKIIEFLNKMGRFSEAGNYNKLSKAAKVFHIVKRKKEVTKNKIREEANKLGWRLNSGEVEEVTSFLADMGFVKIQ